jgi:mitogen-activated protein kinase kinase
VDDDDDEEEDEDEDTEDNGADEEEDEDTDDESESVCGGVRSAGSSLLTVKPSERTAQVRGVWVDAATRKQKRKSKGVSEKSYGGGMSMSIIELMHEIVKEPAPRLCDVGPKGRFSAEAEEFVDACLLKDPETRKTPGVLLVGSVLWLDPMVADGSFFLV